METMIMSILAKIKAPLLATLGGVAVVLYKRIQGQHMGVAMSLCYIALSFITGVIVGEFIPYDMYYRDGLVGISGILSLPIMGVLETEGVNLIKKYISKKTNADN